ncbi:hypothetical protein EOPP23_13755 [Endozoicomonas sp. OPT23]|uniref:protein kinase domain-containing protein n=1 Tax=Endozoicomonas sp. OPT23 TaxID=2072845 RepID=UPI00129BD7D8|nr:protein kinase [Endozoicomonas sp. OPT23]MRI34057.1 hypothetical protein [Endozoicomonas sp. OPT23]
MGITVDGEQPAIPPANQPPPKQEGDFQSKSVTSVMAEKFLEAKVAEPDPQLSETSFKERTINHLTAEKAKNKPKAIPAEIDSGLQIMFRSQQDPVYFSKTTNSVLPDQQPENPVPYSMMSEELKGRIATGSNGFVQKASLSKNEDIVMKRSYCCLDQWKGKTYTLYFAAPAISREAGILTGLKEMASDHPGYQHIVPFLGAGVTTNGEPLILLTRADGVLSDQLTITSGEDKKPGPPLPLRDTLSHTQDLFSGLSCLASLQLVHQDLKPENLLLKDGQLWIADFGESTCYEGFAAMGIHGEKLDMEGRRAGTGATKPFFLTYEEPTPATDVWAAGLVTLQMLNPAKAEDCISRLNNQPLENKGSNGIPFDKLTAEQLTSLETHCKQTIKAFLDDSLTVEDQTHRTAIESLLNRVFDPGPKTRISAADACEEISALTKQLVIKAEPDKP